MFVSAVVQYKIPGNDRLDSDPCGSEYDEGVEAANAPRVSKYRRAAEDSRVGGVRLAQTDDV